MAPFAIGILPLQGRREESAMCLELRDNVGYGKIMQGRLLINSLHAIQLGAEIKAEISLTGASFRGSEVYFLSIKRKKDRGLSFLETHLPK